MTPKPRAENLFLPLEVDFAEDKDIAKLARYRRDARGVRDLLVQMWCYCKRNKTDGHVPFEAVGKLVYPDPPKNGPRDADRLVECGIAERTDEGWFFPGYLKRNKSKEQIKAESEAKREAGRKGGLKSGEVRRKETKQNEAECSDVLEHIDIDIEQSHRTETETPLLTLGGDGSVPSGASLENPPRCTRHRDIPYDDPGPPCNACKRVRVSADQQAAERKATARTVRDNCPICDGSGWRNDNDQRCNHLKETA